MIICIIGRSGLIFAKPSTADEIEMAGVINPSAINEAQPINVGTIIHLAFLSFNKAYKAKMPPSPLLSAFSAKYTYLIVANKNKVQITADKPPKTNPSDKFLPWLVMA